MMQFTTRTILTVAILSISLLSVATANAALISALGGQVVYDTDRNITWANANLATTNTFGVSGIGSGGFMSWNTAKSWIGAMNTANYLGYSDWRLPATLQPDATCAGKSGIASYGYNCTGSEMGHLFYSELGGAAGSSIQSSTNLSLFTNLKSYYYWSGTEYAADTINAWHFNFSNGFQYNGNKSNNMHALAVRPGQVVAASGTGDLAPGTAVPEP